MSWTSRSFWYVLALAGLIAALLYPGLMSPDALTQYVQLKTGNINNLHPPAIIYIWRVTDFLISGTGGMFLLQWGLYATGCWLVSMRLSRPLLAFIILLLFPPALAILISVWKDSLMLAGFMLAVGCITQFRHSRHTGWWWGGIAALTLCAAVRYNAITAIIPLAIYLAILRVHTLPCRITLSLFLTLGTFSGSLFINSIYVQRVQNWPATGIWDIAAISLAEQQMLLPPEALGNKQMTIERLGELFSPISNTSLCRFVPDSGREILCLEKIPLRNGDALRSEDMPALRAYWLSTIAEHPAAYLTHRLRLACHLLDICQHEQLGFCTESIAISNFEGAHYAGPSLQSLGITDTPPPSSWGQYIIHSIAILKQHTPLMNGWLYLLTCLVISVICIFKKRPQSQLIYALSASCWLGFLPIILIAPDMQYRYIIWPVMTGMLSIILFIQRVDANRS